MTTPRMIANSFRNYLAGYDCLVSISDTHEVTLQFSSHVIRKKTSPFQESPSISWPVTRRYAG